MNPGKTAVFELMGQITDRVLVSFSGGKDSAVVFDLCNKYVHTVEGFFWYKVPGLQFQERLLQWYEKRYGVPIHRVPTFQLYDMLASGSFVMIPESHIPRVTVKDVYEHLRGKTGIFWIAGGERINDSIHRRAMLKHCGSIDRKRGRMYPVLEWTKDEILHYARLKRLPISPERRILGHSFDKFEGRDLALIKRYFPEDYERIRDLFPLIEAEVKRYEFYEKKQEIEQLGRGKPGGNCAGDGESHMPEISNGDDIEETDLRGDL